jgi:hypothetical protein
MAEEYKPGQIVPQSDVYTITHDPVHADMPHEVTVIKGRRFPTAATAKTSASSSRMRHDTSPRSTILQRRTGRVSSRFGLLPCRDP